MFVVLDTNHFTELIGDSEFGRRLLSRLELASVDVFLSIITAQESLEGWLAVIRAFFKNDMAPHWNLKGSWSRAQG